MSKKQAKDFIVHHPIIAAFITAIAVLLTLVLLAGGITWWQLSRNTADSTDA